MVSRSVFAASVCAAVFCAVSVAQSTRPAPQQPANSTSQPPAQSSATPATPKLELHDLPAEPHTLTPAEQAQARQQQALNAALRLAALQAHWGPQMSTPGLSIAMKELGRTKTATGTQIRYEITGSGFAPADKLMMVRWPLDGSAKAVMGGIGIDAKGIAICNDVSGAQALADAASKLNAPNEPGAPATTGSAPPAFTPPPSCKTTMEAAQPVEIETTAASGEAIRVALVTEDRKRAAEASAIPFPIESVDKGCKLGVVLSVNDAGLVLLNGEGFPPNTELNLLASTGSAQRELHPRSNGQGKIIVPLLTGEQGKTSGTTTVKFTGVHREPTLDTPKEEATPSPACAPSVSYPWGDGSYKPE
jgi:hypothetical protein